MAEGLPWFPFYASDWLTAKKVRRLTWSQRGVYATLLAEQWVGGALPCDHTEVAALVGATPDDVRAVLDACFFPAVEGWKNERLEEVRAEQAAKSSALAKAGRKGGKAKQRNKLDGASQATARLQPGSSIRAEQSRADKSRTDTPPSVEHASEGGKKKRKAALPPDWRPNEGHQSRAKASGLNVELEAEAFRDHHTAKGSVMLDWDAAFRTWLRNAVKFQARDSKRPSEAASEAILAREAEGWSERKRATEEAIARDLAKRTTAPPIANEPSGPLAGILARTLAVVPPQEKAS